MYLLPVRIKKFNSKEEKREWKRRGREVGGGELSREQELCSRGEEDRRSTEEGKRRRGAERRSSGEMKKGERRRDERGQ